MAPAGGSVQRMSEHAALLISPLEQDRDFLQQLFKQQGWTLYPAASLGAASTLLAERAITVIVTEHDLPDGSRCEVLNLAQQCPLEPVVIVISRLADAAVWAKALNLGAFDVLTKPLDQAEVVRVLQWAWHKRSTSHVYYLGHRK